MAHNYILQVTAGSDYDPLSHKVVPVNESQHITIESEHLHADLNVRIQSYRGLPRSSPSTSPYFDLPPHDKNKDQYSISFQFQLKSNINGDDLVFGNDFDHPIRDRLPPGFGTAFKIVKWVADPGLDGDVYADKPYLYGPALSSFNALHVGGKEMAENTHEAGLVFEEGGAEDGLEVRKENGIPETQAGRKKHFLNEENRKGWEWEEGRVYGCDFFNPYLDFNDFALRLPGFTLPIMKYWDGQGLRTEQKRSHTLRYVLKNRATDEVLLVVLFALYLKEDVSEDGKIKNGIQGAKPLSLMSPDERERYERAVNGELSDAGTEKEKEMPQTTNDDDVD
ncbi:Uncharacterized protein BP5553_07946 [Venustampulla echinocandica]|uniref:Domain of unknown function at the cortex 1 domain-containing protein n=1 Tax=Venustampulla echinocandica TaxID=2656787 RepID=A0A370TF96_9HELO|nr:Uncharacterized protein BP5553_07946 [Venustampulla echinocandica]RDL33578.1 Uncharacterized protein BP5553_07946 [Venustampulla echinocandica]